MALLYLVTESSRDALFYRQCAKLLGRRDFSWCQDKQYRKGDGSHAVQAHLKYALRQAKAAAGGEEEVCFVAAIDNDRTPHLENQPILQRAKLSAKERNRPPRLPWVEGVAHEVLGPDPLKWPLLTAFAVPVEMLEAWTVKAFGLDRSGDAPPHFSRQDQQRARDYYHPIAPPPQWKDLEQLARERCQIQDSEAFYVLVVGVMASNPEDLIAKSSSFEHFYRQFVAW